MADRQLAAFEKVSIEPGETATVTLPIDRHALSYWDAECHDWRAAAASYEILVGSSSRRHPPDGSV